MSWFTVPVILVREWCSETAHLAAPVRRGERETECGIALPAKDLPRVQTSRRICRECVRACPRAKVLPKGMWCEPRSSG